MWAEWLYGCAKPLYETNEDIMKWMQAVEEDRFV